MAQREKDILIGSLVAPPFKALFQCVDGPHALVSVKALFQCEDGSHGPVSA